MLIQNKEPPTSPAIQTQAKQSCKINKLVVDIEFSSNFHQRAQTHDFFMHVKQQSKSVQVIKANYASKIYQCGFYNRILRGKVRSICLNDHFLFDDIQRGKTISNFWSKYQKSMFLSV